MGIGFDPDKDRRNRRKHGISLARFADMDPATQVLTADLRRDYGEDRWIVVGLIGTRVHVAVVTFRGDRPWVINLRRATRQEQRTYDQAPPRS